MGGIKHIVNRGRDENGMATQQIFDQDVRGFRDRGRHSGLTPGPKLLVGPAIATR